MDAQLTETLRGNLLYLDASLDDGLHLKSSRLVRGYTIEKMARLRLVKPNSAHNFRTGSFPWIVMYSLSYGGGQIEIRPTLVKRGISISVMPPANGAVDIIYRQSPFSTDCHLLTHKGQPIDYQIQKKDETLRRLSAHQIERGEYELIRHYQFDVALPPIHPPDRSVLFALLIFYWLLNDPASQAAPELQQPNGR